ncbi:hypothetical protein PC110_g23346 [Phytophthora cactorum]|uniref:Uncharacterized protein n=1 Tax=Phytophthora cactorum TaxID=29920 RepID=A0A329R9R9_9STRA|nr:hypothetical protein PC110_g23346 [Phytophthora cactorum]
MTATSRRLTRVNVAQLLKARATVPTTANHGGTSLISSEASIRTVEVANAASIKTAEVVPAASIKTLVENETSIVTTGVHSMDHVLRVVGISHSAHFCNKRCMFCKQAHDVGQCELFRNFQDLAKFVRIKGTKEELPLSSSLPFKSAI